MFRVYGLIWHHTVHQETCHRAINSREENHTKWWVSLVEVITTTFSQIRQVLIYVLFLFLKSGAQSSMRTSKSMPDSNMRKFSKWGSINTDSGISLFSSDTMRPRDAMSISSSNSSSITANVQRGSLMLPPEGVPLAANKMAQQLEDARRFVMESFFLNFSHLNFSSNHLDRNDIISSRHCHKKMSYHRLCQQRIYTNPLQPQQQPHPQPPNRQQL